MKSIFLLLAATLATVVAQDGSLVIDTQFTTPAGGKIQTVDAPTASDELPLKWPTRISVSEPSVVEGGSESVGNIKPPYALAKVGERPDNPEAPANLHVLWDTKQVPLEPGRYVLKVRLGILDALTDAGNLVVNLCDEEGKELLRAACPMVVMPNLKFLSPPAYNRQIAFSPGEVYDIEIQMDTAKMVWGSSVNGQALREEAPFDAALTDNLSGGVRIGGLSYFSVGGGNNSRPGSSVAFFDTKLIKLK